MAFSTSQHLNILITQQIAIDWRARQRKHLCITYHVHTGKNDAAYEMHDMVCHPPKTAFALQPNLPEPPPEDINAAGYRYRSGTLPPVMLI